MNTCSALENLVYCSEKPFKKMLKMVKALKTDMAPKATPELKARIKAAIFAIIVFAVFVAMPILEAYGEVQDTTKTIRMRLCILPRAELIVDEKQIEKTDYSLNFEEVRKNLTEGDSALRVDKVFRNGTEMVRVTKVFEEALY